MANNGQNCPKKQKCQKTVKKQSKKQSKMLKNR